ncbi:TIGR03086 family metal-binding protein [Geodermatophilus saharensis]|nr:TIGR03086 family metal-binding protein [Geodermatophilus saharensis]
MPDPADVLDRLESALGTTGAVVAGIAPTRWNDPTPCPEWDVRTLTNHLVGGLRIFTAQLTGADAGGAHEDDWLDGHPSAAYRDAADAVLAAWRAPGALARTLTISLGPVPAPLGAVIELTEVVVHGLDLAVATGRLDQIDQAQAEWLLALMEGMGFDAFRLPGVFGPAVPVPVTAPAHLRLLGFLGRALPAAEPLPA